MQCIFSLSASSQGIGQGRVHNQNEHTSCEATGHCTKNDQGVG